MTDKSLKVYIGDDRLPVQDLTDYVDWPDSRFIGQAYNGESAVSSVVFRDESARFGPWVDSPVTIAVRNEIEVVHGSNFLYRGRWIGRTWERGVQKAYQAREVTAEAEDVNVELRGLIVDGWVRPAETDRARVLALREDYLDGSVRAGTNLATTYVSSSNTVTLPAKTYTQTDPLGVLQDVAFQTHKQFFVTIDKELFYDGWDSGAYACSFRITDDEAELRTSPTTTLGIIPDSGPLFAINGQRFIDGVRLYYGAGSTDYVDVTHPGLSSAKAHWRETVYAPDSITNATEAANLAETILQERSQDGRTFTLSVCHASGGPLTDAQVGSVKPGMLIRIKARVLPYFLTNGLPNYAYVTTRIVSLQWHMPLPGQYFATLKLEKPERTFGIGVPPGPRPPSAGAPSIVLGGVGDVSGADLEIPSGLTDSAMIIVVGRHLNADPSSVRWTVGATVQDAVFVGDVDGTNVGIGLYYVLNPTSGIGNALASGGAVGLWDGAWVLQNVNQTTPIVASTFGTGTGNVTAISGTAPGGSTILDAVYVGHDDFTNDGHPPAPTATGGQTLDAAGGLQLGPPGYSDWLIGMGHGDSSPGWTQNQSRPWAGVVIAVQGSGPAVTSDVGDTSDAGTDSGFYANANHEHGHGIHTADYHTNYVQENILTTAGDVPYATGASTWTRLPIGASNFHMRSDGTKPVWSPESPALTNPMDAVGDLIRGGAAGTPTKLAIGASNFALKSTGTIPEWSNTLRLSYIDLDEHTLGLPPSPPAGVIRLYGSNSKGYYENSGGTVVELGGAGGGGTSLTIEEVDASPSVAATKLVLPNGTLGVVGTVATYTPSGGGTVDWAQDISESGASFANFTANTGTWASSGTVITQTDAGAAHKRARHNTKVILGLPLIVEVEVKITSGTGVAGFLIGYDGAAGTGGVGVSIDDANNRIQVESGAIAVRDTAMTATIATNTFYKLRAYVNGSHVSIVLDGTLLGSAYVSDVGGSTDPQQYIGLWSWTAAAEFRNFKVWTLSTGVPA
jgi:hypothetical protein